MWGFRLHRWDRLGLIFPMERAVVGSTDIMNCLGEITRVAVSLYHEASLLSLKQQRAHRLCRALRAVREMVAEVL